MDKNQTELFERKRIAELLNRLKEHGRTMKEERRKLCDSEKDSQGPYFVWDRLEILSADIIGYISRIDSVTYRLKDPQKAISHLHKLSIFDVDCIMKWYPTAAQEYPKIKQYFELLDYIRLLALDFIQQYLLQKEVAEK